jgi:hypothetical protein
MTTSPLSFVAVFGSGFRDPGWVKNQDPGSGINIPDPQHWSEDVGGEKERIRIRIRTSD